MGASGYERMLWLFATIVTGTMSVIFVMAAFVLAANWLFGTGLFSATAVS